MIRKQLYETPEMEVVTIKSNDSILTGSGTVEDMEKRSAEWDD